MSVSLYFGLPGCGKSTTLTKFAYDASRAIDRDIKRAEKGKKTLCPYKHIYGNIELTGILHYHQIKFDWLGRYDIRDALILIDEATLEVDSRDFKSFKEHSKRFMLMHRHYNVDIIFFTQQWDGIDKKIRVITDRVYYVYKGVFTGKWLTRMYRVPYGIIIPDPKKDSSEKLGEIVQGYCKPSLLVRLFSPYVVRSFYYPYFDSWECPVLDPIPVPDSINPILSRWKKNSPTAECGGENS